VKASICALALVGCLASAVVSAQEPAYSSAYSACIRAADGDTFEMMGCVSEEHQRWDKQLNVNYKKLMDGLAPEQQKKLRAAQRLWLQSRDAGCSLYDDLVGARFSAMSCMLVETSERAEMLRILTGE